MDPRTDGELLAAWRVGDRGAFGRLVDRHQGPLLRHAQALAGERSVAEDAVQEAFLRLARRPPELRASGDEAEHAQLASWLHTVTRNRIMDVQRSEARRRRRERAVALHEAAPGGDGRVEAEDTRAAVERSLERLPADQREVLALRLFGDRSYKEIAAITGRKVGTVGWLVSVGLKALARELEPLLEPGTAVPPRDASLGVRRS